MQGRTTVMIVCTYIREKISLFCPPLISLAVELVMKLIHLRVDYTPYLSHPCGARGRTGLTKNHHGVPPRTSFTLFFAVFMLANERSLEGKHFRYRAGP